MVKKVIELIEELSKVKSTNMFYNIYGSGVKYNFECSNAATIRRKNLGKYFNFMMEEEPTFLFVGEAPGYKGCMYSGIPFTSEYIMIENGYDIPFFGSKKGYKKTSKEISLQKENTATIFWEQLSELEFYPLIWNIFPFHPHDIRQPLTNRTPNNNEIEIGLEYLINIIEIYDIQHLVAIGNRAEFGLNNLDVELPINKIRHPSFGGKNEFIRGLMYICEKYL